MLEYVGICVNLSKTAWMDFYMFFPILTVSLLERMVNYFNKVYSIKKWGYFPEDKSLIFSIVATIIFIILWDFLMFYQVFLSPQVKQCAIIVYKNGINELPDQLPNNSGANVHTRKKKT